MGSVSQDGRNVIDVNDRGARVSNKLETFDYNDQNVISDELKPKESKSQVYDSLLSLSENDAGNGTVATEVSSGYGFEVGDMVWGKVKSHPWWPGHVYSEEFATSSVRRSKTEGQGLLLVAFFGDSSYGWFHPSELIPFDCNFADKSLQTNSRTFVKAVEEAIDEVSRRSGLGLSCMCQNKQTFRPTTSKGFFAVDVADYEPGAVYSTEAIQRARDGFKPRLALDFVRQLALEPACSKHAEINFIKNKATVMSYRKAVYEEFDETYAQAFDYHPVHPPGSLQELPPVKKPSKAPLSGREVFADAVGKVKNPSKPNKLKDHTKKDKYLFKRRDESKEVKTHQKEKRKETSYPQFARFDDPKIDAGDKMLEKGFSEKHKQDKITVADGELALPDATGTVASMEDTHTTSTVLELDNPGFETNTSKVGSPGRVGLVVDKSSSESKVFTQDEIPKSEPHKIVAQQRVISELKKVKVTKRPAGEMGSVKSALPENKKKRKKESSMSDGTHIHGKEGVSTTEKVTNKPLPSSLVSKPPIEVELSRVLGDLHLFALDPFRTIDRGLRSQVRQVLLRFRSLVFQKRLNSSLVEGGANDANSGRSAAIIPASSGSKNGIGGLPVKVQARFSGRPDDPTKGGLKRGPSVRLEENSAKKKKKISEMRKLTNETKVIKKIDEPSVRVDGRQPQAVVTTSKKSGPDLIKKTEQRAPEPTMLLMKFPSGGSLPSINELKARFARYGPLDHSATRIYWKTLTCRVVYRNKSHAQAAHKFVVGSSSMFGNRDVKCFLKEFVVVGAAEPEPAHQASVLPATPAGVQPKSCLKKPGGEDTGGNSVKETPRVKFMLTGDESHIADGADASSFSSSHATMDNNSKNLQMAVLPIPAFTTVTSSTDRFTKPQSLPPQPPPRSVQLPPQLLPLQPPSKLNRPIGPPPLPNTDIALQMLSLLTKCNDVVTNVTGIYGYVPYHPL